MHAAVTPGEGAFCHSSAHDERRPHPPQAATSPTNNRSYTLQEYMRQSRLFAGEVGLQARSTHTGDPSYVGWVSRPVFPVIFSSTAHASSSPSSLAYSHPRTTCASG